jgi:pimeloyl-ACP methyl ester carboxylesterase
MLSAVQIQEERMVRANGVDLRTQAFGEPNWRNRLKDIRTPTLVMHGTHDYCLPLDHGQALAQEIPGARLVVVEGMGHVLSPNSLYWHVFADALIAHTAE